MADWLTEGAARRSDSRIAPVMHLLVRDSGGSDSGWLLWCGGSPGIPFVPAAVPRRCSRCRALAREAVAEETLDAADVAGWLERRADQ